MITQDELKKILNYNKNTGIFTWKERPSCCIQVGDIAGGLSNGYISIKIYKKAYKAHRLVFLYVDGFIPEHFVDHKNGIKTDNRWDNLRHVTNSCNSLNTVIPKNNKSGFIGVNWCKRTKKWESRIMINGRRIFLGHFDTPEDAAVARCEYETANEVGVCNEQKYNFLKLSLIYPEINQTNNSKQGE